MEGGLKGGCTCLSNDKISSGLAFKGDLSWCSISATICVTTNVDGGDGRLNELDDDIPRIWAPGKPLASSPFAKLALVGHREVRNILLG